MKHCKMPNETDEYRSRRNELLAAEIENKDARERLAALRRKLPLGGRVKEDYVFKEGPRDLSDSNPSKMIDTPLSQLFKNGPELVVAHLMFNPKSAEPCGLCNMGVDGYNAVAPHLNDRTAFVVVAAAPIGKLRTWAFQRGWQHIRLLSCFDNNFNLDYHMEEEDRSQNPGVSVFKKDKDGTISHCYTTEQTLLPGAHRGIDLFTPVWNLLDLLPSGREEWMPEYAYPDQPKDWPEHQGLQAWV